MTERENDPAQGAPELPTNEHIELFAQKLVREQGLLWLGFRDDGSDADRPHYSIPVFSQSVGDLVRACLTADRQAPEAPSRKPFGWCGEAEFENDFTTSNRVMLQWVENGRRITTLFAASEAEAVKVEAVEKCCVNCLHYTKGADEWPCRGCGIESSEGPFDHWEPLRATPSPQAAEPVSVEAVSEARKLPENAREWTDAESAAFRQGWSFGRKEGIRATPAVSRAEGLEPVPLDRAGVASLVASEDTKRLEQRARQLIAALDQPFRYPHEIKTARDALAAVLGDSK